MKDLFDSNEWSATLFSSGINKIIQGWKDFVRFGLRHVVVLSVFQNDSLCWKVIQGFRFLDFGSSSNG